MQNLSFCIDKTNLRSQWSVDSREFDKKVLVTKSSFVNYVQDHHRSSKSSTLAVKLQMKIGKRISSLGSGQSATVDLYESRISVFAVKTFRGPFKEAKLAALKESSISEKLASCGHFGMIIALNANRLTSKVSLIMEYYPVTLTKFIDRQPGTIEKLRIFKQIVKGVEFMHSCGISHRDLKVDNVCIDKKGKAKIIDFGTCLVSEGATEQVSTGVYGTDPFVSPEAGTSLKYMGYQHDLWSLGIILYVLVTKNGETSPHGAQKSVQGIARGSNVKSKFINYPWNKASSSDIDYLAYEIHQKQLESRDVLLVSRLESTLESYTLPDPLFVDSVEPYYVTFSLINLKNRKFLSDCEIGVYRLFRSMVEDAPHEVWRTMARLLRLSATRGTAALICEDGWWDLV